VNDKFNHCIRKINLELGVSETFAGVCGTAGFMDGPTGVNLFNSPGSFGRFYLSVRRIRLIFRD